MKSNIRKLRNETQITQSELAHVIGKTQQAISQMEQDRDRISIEALIDMADYFEVSTDYILGLKEDKNNPAVKMESIPENSLLGDIGNIRLIASDGDADKKIIYELILSLLVYLFKQQATAGDKAMPEGTS